MAYLRRRISCLRGLLVGNVLVQLWYTRCAHQHLSLTTQTYTTFLQSPMRRLSKDSAAALAAMRNPYTHATKVSCIVPLMSFHLLGDVEFSNVQLDNVHYSPDFIVALCHLVTASPCNLCRLILNTGFLRICSSTVRATYVVV